MAEKEGSVLRMSFSSLVKGPAREKVAVEKKRRMQNRRDFIPIKKNIQFIIKKENFLNSKESIFQGAKSFF
ncbi:hypothetical protein A7K73_05485 [Candidatus Methylacidiphilum fumarolicum]|uniref:hypothetical protein n=1 Tax=Candidatus Methylacidiphilum fumarolicum TaxID=591154 RepID=UPI0006622518|nr:hypothetical protein [Candidatus Methylacidiphilum fumarolicum]MBW6415210.1 hypothetical protein [Candidatus Methylacidiphilum fumarolicum]TFE69825.1 hypothetical protein A7K73_05485 [Candidatus Methylacidiphilum fumarolicum]TFE76695.1 hypothetical protein A7D33_08650 [Candidatus Methylacidiphilum fumarolicum]